MNVAEKSKKIAYESSRVYVAAGWLFCFSVTWPPKSTMGLGSDHFFNYLHTLPRSRFFVCPTRPCIHPKENY